MSSGILGIGIRSILAYQNALNVTSRNLANVATPYYSRREIDFADALFGNGVNVADIRRVYDETASHAVQQANSNFSKMDVYLQRIQDFESLLDDNSNSVGRYITDSLNALRTLNSSNTDQNRSVYLNKLSSLANQFQFISGQISLEQQNTNSSINDVLDTANQIIQGIANINQQIITTQGSDQSDLLDQREQLVQELAQYFDFTTLTDNYGQLNIYMGNGILLVEGDHGYQLQTIANSSYPDNLDIIVNTGSESILVTDGIQSGQLAGLLEYRDTSLAGASQALGRLALAITDTLNTQNKLGMDKNGNLGVNIFNDINNPNALIDRVIPNLNNTGSENLTVNIDDVTALTTTDYQLYFDTSGSYKLTRISDGSLASFGSISSLPQAITVDGFTININAGPIIAGDEFIISPTNNAANSMSVAITDGSLLALALPIDAVKNLQSGSDLTIKAVSVNDTTNPAFTSALKQLSPPITIQFLTPTSYQIVDSSTSAVLDGPIAYTPPSQNIFPTPGGLNYGYQITIEGQNIKAGDTINVNYNAIGTGDVRNGQVMASLYEEGIVNDKYTFVQGYDLLTHDVIVQSNSAQAQYDATQVVQMITQKRFDDISAVNTEEESINLSLYQQAFLASSQILEVANSIFDVLTSLLRK